MNTVLGFAVMSRSEDLSGGRKSHRIDARCFVLHVVVQTLDIFPEISALNLFTGLHFPASDNRTRHRDCILYSFSLEEREKKRERKRVVSAGREASHETVLSRRSPC